MRERLARRGRGAATAPSPRPLDPEDAIGYVHRFPAGIESRLAELARLDSTAFLECLSGCADAVCMADLAPARLQRLERVTYILEQLAQAARHGRLDDLHRAVGNWRDQA